MKERIRFEQEIFTLTANGGQTASSFPLRKAVLSQVTQTEAELFGLPDTEIDASVGKTLYLPIQLNKTVLPKVGVFLPASFQPSVAPDIIVYLHGHIIPDCQTEPVKFNKDGIEYYWNTPLFLCLRDELALSGRNAILIAPTFKPIFAAKGSPSSYFGDLDLDGKFDFLINECLGYLKKAKLLPDNAQPRHLILTGHSGGGLAMQAIVSAQNMLLQNIAECWGFECLYFGWREWWCWLTQNPPKKFLHFRRKSKFQEQTKKLAIRKNFTDVPEATDHCKSVQEKWRQAIDNSLLLKTVAPQRVVQEFENIAEAEFIEEDLLKEHPLSSTRKKLFTYQDGVTIESSPAVYVPQILRLAAELARKEGKSETAAQLDPTKFFQQFTRQRKTTGGGTEAFTFLGRKLNDEEYIHVALANLLQKIEAKFVADLQLTPQKAGDKLLLNSSETLAGTRPQSSTAKYSYHLFGLAVDVNYLGNPFIESANDIDAVNNVLKNAAELMHTTALSYAQQVTGKFKDRFDYVQERDSLLEKYFALLDDTSELERYRQSAPAWKSRSLDEARTRIEKDLEWLSGVLERGDKFNPKKKKWQYKRKAYFKQHAILSFDKTFVLGMEKSGLYWGGNYGDMMHFDMRNIGLGKYLEKARLDFVGKVAAQAKALFKDKKTGTYTTNF